MPNTQHWLKLFAKAGLRNASVSPEIASETKFSPTFTQKTNQWKQKTPHFGRGLGPGRGQGAAAALAAGQDGDGDDEDTTAGAEVGAGEVVDGGDEQEEGGEGPGGEELQQQEAVHSPREVPPDRLVLEPGESLGHGAVIKTPA